MKGLELEPLKGGLSKISSRMTRNSVRTIRDKKEKLDPHKGYIADNFGEKFSFFFDYHKLPLEVLGGFSFEDLCKMKLSSPIMMHRSVEKLFETDFKYELVRKIISSIWRWGYQGSDWNEIVDAQTCICDFDFHSNPDFQIRLDYTTSFNERGRSQHSRIFLDGVFAFLVYYKGEHVLTIGFSVLGGKRILIQQVQSPKRTGNRYLYKLPTTNRMEFVVGLFRKNFADYDIFVVDGGSLVDNNLNNYRVGRERRLESLMFEYRGRAFDLAVNSSEIREIDEKISHIANDRPRLVSFYDNLGHFQKSGERFERHGLTHYKII